MNQKNKGRGRVSLFLFILCSVLCTVYSFSQNLGSLNRESIEKYLKKAKVVSIETDRGRRTESWEINLDDGKIQGKGFFKLANRERPNLSGGDSYKYVLASYELDKMLGLNLVPPTVERKIDNKRGSLMLFLESPVINEKERRQKNLVPPDPLSFKKAMCDLTVFEHLIFFQSLCSQRDLENILIQTDKNWKVWLIDLSEAFEPAPRLILGCEITECSDDLFHKIENLSEKKLKVWLGKYLGDDEITALLIRKNLIVKRIKELRAKK